LVINLQYSTVWYGNHENSAYVVSRNLVATLEEYHSTVLYLVPFA